jgi:LPS sulfotransferase NodH
MPFRLHRYLWGVARTNYPLQWARVSCGRALDWIRSNNFLVLSSPRSGTTLLVDYLNCSRSIRCYGEILGPGHIQYGRAYRMSPARLGTHVESFFVKRPGRVTGAKIMTFHLDELSIDLHDLIEWLARPKIVVLYRADMLEQYASFKLAERYGVWHSRKPTDVGPIWLDPDDCLAFVARERRMWRDNFAHLDGADVHLMSYETLSRRPDAAMHGVFQFLGVRPVPVRSRLVRTNPQPLWRKVANYDELAARGVPADCRLVLPSQARASLHQAAA